MPRCNAYLAVVSLLLCGAWAFAETPAAPTASDARLRLLQIFPPTDDWNLKIDGKPIDPNSARILKRIGLNKSMHPDFGTPYQGHPNGIPYVVVSGNQPLVPVEFEYKDESDPGPYPIPPDAPIEGGQTAAEGDRHVIVIDADNNKLYETWSSVRKNNGASWTAGSGAIFDLKTNKPRPLGWTSADAAGLPIFPGLVRYDEAVNLKAIPHALRFTLVHTRRAYVPPARHFAAKSNDEDLPPMGMRLRLKATFDLTNYPPESKVILQALKTYGMILADNGSDMFLSGSPDDHWDDQDLGRLKHVKAADFEVIEMKEPRTK